MLYNMDPCVLSSLIFLINIILGGYMHSYIYIILFTLLMSTSILFHSFRDTSLKYADMFAVACVTAYGAYLFFTKCKRGFTSLRRAMAFAIVACFFSCLYVYRYWAFIVVPIGSFKTYPYHSYIHYFTSFGNTLLLFF